MVRAFVVVFALLGVLALGFVGCGTDGVPGGAPASATTGQPASLGDNRYVQTAPEYRPPPTPVPMAAPSSLAVRQEESRPYSGNEWMERNAPARGVDPSAEGDKYAPVYESGFVTVADAPLSTFSIDVDTASYAKTRAWLQEHHALPPPDAVRIEELINYFDYSYPGPTDESPFAVHIETTQCPWQANHRLVRVGIQGKQIDRQRVCSNLVFLIDVSGSMNQPNKLPLVQRGLSMLVRQLGENDRVAIVVYAGAAGVVLPSTNGTEQGAILAAIQRLRAGGSTNGSQGIQLAYQIAQEQFIEGGVNRVLLCTDGDFNVGTTSPGDLIRLAQEKAKSGVFLSVLGFGFGNHNDAMLEQLSDKANGNYAFIDSDREAYKTLVEQMQGTLVTIAKDVKLQVEFNPAQVASYRLIGYENRRLADRDFNDDRKDAGEIGAGHSVTALYEIVPSDADNPAARPEVDPLKYQARGSEERRTEHSAVELLTLKLRYQPPSGGASKLREYVVKDSKSGFGSASADLQFSAAVASFGMLLRNSKFKGSACYATVLETASSALGNDRKGQRREFLEVVRTAQRLAGERERLSGEQVGAVPFHWQPEFRSFAAAPYGTNADRTKDNVFMMGLVAGAITIALLVCAIIGFARVVLFLSLLRRRPSKFGSC